MTGMPTATRAVRVVIVDDHRVFRSGVRAELAGAVNAGRLEIVGEAGDVEEAVAVVARERPDVVLLDVHLPGGLQRPGGREVLVRSAGLLAGHPDADRAVDHLGDLEVHGRR